MELAAYLKRINYCGPRAPTIDVLREIHRLHTLAVPFENLDIHLGVSICLDREAFFDKIVGRYRGGFCYEVNSLFGHFLAQLGFKVDLISARVFNAEGQPGRDRAHLALLVHLDRPYLADVGFGDLCSEPLCVEDQRDQRAGAATYRLTHADGAIKLEQVLPDQTPKPKYVFTREPLALEDFSDMCRYQQSSPDSGFVRRRLCTLATPTGRLTLNSTGMCITENDRRTETPIATDGEFSAALLEHFDIDIPAHAWRRPLAAP